MSKFLKWPCETIGKTQYWEHVSSPPKHNQWVWGFIPEIGNDDEGYGYIDLVYWECWKKLFYDRNGVCDIQPLMWCELNEPEIPFIHETQEGSRENALGRITRKD